MGAAEGAPDQAALGGIEGQPVSGIAPVFGNAFAAASPGLAAVRALEETHIGVVHIDVPRIEGIELHAVVGGYIQAAGDPTAVGELPGVHLLPGCAAVEGAIGAEEVGRVDYVGIGGRNTQAVRRVEPDVAAILPGALLDPASAQVGGWLVRFLEDNLPGLAAVRCLGDAVEQVLLALADLKASETGIGDLRVAIAGGDGFKTAGGLLERGRNRTPVQAGVLGEIYLSVLAGCVDPDRVAGPRRAGCSYAGWDAALVR